MGKFEIIVETVEDAIAAARGGATQLDLKSHYPCSGITPSAGTIARVLEKVSIPVLVMIRPHARSFIPTKEDILTACEEIRQAKKLGAKHFLTGFINTKNELHLEALKALKDAAGDCEMHAHLAWELTDDPEQSLEDLVALGFSSLRASGKTSSTSAFGGDVSDAVQVINQYKKIAENRIKLLLAGGITKENISSTIIQTGITNIHCGRGVRTPPEASSPVNEAKVRDLRKTQMNAIAKLLKKEKI